MSKISKQKFNESAVRSRCDRILQGTTLPKIPNLMNFRGADKKIPSKITTGPADTFKHQTCSYTGDKIIGIATMHKSSAVPVFSKDEAVDISKMRR
jgi:hypothetical protein